MKKKKKVRVSQRDKEIERETGWRERMKSLYYDFFLLLSH